MINSEAAGGKPITRVLSRYVPQGMGDGVAEPLASAGFEAAEDGLDFALHSFNAIEVGTVGEQEADLGSDAATLKILAPEKIHCK